MEEVLIKLASFKRKGIKIGAPSESDASIRYFIRLRALLASGSESKIPPAPFQKALADITVSFDPATKDAGGFTLLITAARQLLPLFPAQKQYMIIALQRIVDLTIAAGVPLPIQPDNEDIDPPFLPPQASSSTSTNSKIFVNRPPISNSPPTSPVLASKNIDTQGERVESFGPPNQKRKLETETSKSCKKASGPDSLTWIPTKGQDVSFTTNCTDTTSVISHFIPSAYPIYSNQDKETIRDANAWSMHINATFPKSIIHANKWEWMRKNLNGVETEEEEIDELEEDTGAVDRLKEGGRCRNDNIIHDIPQRNPNPWKEINSQPPPSHQLIYLRPPITWRYLLQEAFLSHPSLIMTAPEIHQSILLKYPFFKKMSESARRSVGRSLSEYKEFAKKEIGARDPSHRKRIYWTLVGPRREGS